MFSKKIVVFSTLLSLTAGSMDFEQETEKWKTIPVLNNPVVLSEFVKTNLFTKIPASHNLLNYALGEDKIEHISELGGQKFPLCPGIVEKMCTESKGKNVLEIAGAKGILAQTLALFGANTVRICEIEEKQKELFYGTFSLTTKYIPALKGHIDFDCADYFEKYKNYTPGSFDVVICQNLIHFLNTDKQDELVKSAHSLLVPGGKVFFSSNYLEPSLMFSLEQSSHKKSFLQTFIMYKEGYDPSIMYKKRSKVI